MTVDCEHVDLPGTTDMFAHKGMVLAVKNIIATLDDKQLLETAFVRGQVRFFMIDLFTIGMFDDYEFQMPETY